MLFNSIEFLIFFPAVTLLFFLLPHKYRWLHLLAASCFFYCYFIPVYIFILFFTIIIDYYAGILIESAATHNKRKQYLLLSLLANIGLLAYFKYYNFFIGNLNGITSAIGWNYSLDALAFILPVGLSFHTFKAMSYTLEIYRGHQKAERHFGIYALYVMFYPQLVAGPIERPQNILPQFHEKKEYDPAIFYSGIRLMLWGLFKKVVIADRLAIYVNLIYAHPEKYHYGNLLLAVFLFAIQIYCDFSGYSDMAIGCAKTMGYDLMTNFRAPFLSRSITEFWRRWHISLSSWFNDYVFTPFITHRRDWGKWAIVAGLFITFFLSGLWHGAGWNFVVYGLLHGLILIYEFQTKKVRKTIFGSLPAWLRTFISAGLVFVFVSFAWIYFRAENIEHANTIIKYIFTRHSPVPFANYLKDYTLSFIFNKFSFYISLVFVSLLFIIDYFIDPRLEKFSKWPARDIGFSVFIFVMILFFGVFKSQSFIYFQF